MKMMLMQTTMIVMIRLHYHLQKHSYATANKGNGGAGCCLRDKKTTTMTEKVSKEREDKRRAEESERVREKESERQRPGGAFFPLLPSFRILITSCVGSEAGDRGARQVTLQQSPAQSSGTFSRSVSWAIASAIGHRLPCPNIRPPRLLLLNMGSHTHQSMVKPQCH